MSYYSIQNYNAKEMKEFHTSYKQVRITNDERFGKVSIYKSLTNAKDLVFTIVKNFQSEKQQKDYLKELLLRDQMGENQLKSKIRAYHSVTNKGMCGSTLSVTLIVDYFELSLENEIKRRAKDDNNRFEEVELWYILGSLAGLFAQWQEQKFFHGDIYANNIGMNSEGELKVWDNAVVSQHPNSLVKAFSQKNNCYLSPVQMDSFASKKTNINHDVFKADVFALGMLMMELAQLRSSNQYYVWAKHSINFEKIERDLAEINGIYSHEFVQQIRQMLIVNADVRPNFIQLSQSIETSRNSAPQEHMAQSYNAQQQQIPVISQSQYTLDRPTIVEQPRYVAQPQYTVERPTIVEQPTIMRSSVVQQPPMVIQEQQPIVHQQPMVIQEQAPLMQSYTPQVYNAPMTSQPMMSAQPVITQQPMMSAQPIMSSQPMMSAQPIMSSQPMMSVQPVMNSQPMMSAQPMMSGSVINRSPIISNSSLTSSTLNRGPIMNSPPIMSSASMMNSPPMINGGSVVRSPVNLGASQMNRPPMNQPSQNGAISQNQMDAMLQSGVVRRGPNGELKA